MNCSGYTTRRFWLEKFFWRYDGMESSIELCDIEPLRAPTTMSRSSGSSCAEAMMKSSNDSAAMKSSLTA